MIGLDRAGVIINSDMEPEMITASILRDFEHKYGERLKKSEELIRVDHQWVNSFKVKEKSRGSRVIIDFNYPRYFEKHNIEPLRCEKKRIEVENEICKIFEKLTKEEYKRCDFDYVHLEVAMQMNVGAFYRMHNIVYFLYKVLNRNFAKRDTKKKTFGDYSTTMNKFYSTGFMFEIEKGILLEIYSKLHEYNPRSEKTEVGGKLRGEFKFSKNGLKTLFNTSNTELLSFNHIFEGLREFNESNMLPLIKEGIEEDLLYLERKLAEFNPRELRCLVRDYQEWAIDEKIMCLAVSTASNTSQRQVERYRKKTRTSLKESQERSSPLRDNFGNLERMVDFCKKILLLDVEFGLNYSKSEFKFDLKET